MGNEGIHMERWRTSGLVTLLAALLTIGASTLGCDSPGGDSGNQTQQVCTPAELVCIAGSLQRCSDDGSALVLLEECEHGCNAGKCLPQPVCVASCEGRQCGKDGCGGTCGTCGEEQMCVDWMCVNPDSICDLGELTCDGDSLMECAEDGSEWLLVEECELGCDQGQCNQEAVCVPHCTQRECGDDGCEGSCVECAQKEICVDGQCEPDTACKPECEGRQCGSDGCGEECGQCEQGFQCNFLSGLCKLAGPSVVKGSLAAEYLRVESNDQGVIELVGPNTMPAAGVSVLVFTDDGQTLLGSGEVQEDGSFEVGLEQPVTGSELVLFAAIWVPYPTSNLPAPLSVLKPESGGAPYIGYHDYWVWNVAIDAQGDAGDVVMELADGSGAVFLLLLAREAMKTILDDFLQGDMAKLASVAMLWNNDVDWSCGACYSNAEQYSLDQTKLADNSVWISGNAQGSSAWGSPVILHELGHYVARNYSRDDSPGGAHYVGELLNPAFAWSEGWASFFGVSTFSKLIGQATGLFWDIQQGGSFWIDFDAASISAGGMLVAPDPSMGMEQKLDENWVATMLWHLWDGADFPDPEDDGTALGTLRVVSAVTSSRFLYADRGAKGADFVDFVDAALCQFTDLAQSIVETVTNYLSFPHDGLPLCANRALAPMELALDVLPQGKQWLIRAVLDVKGGLPSDVVLDLKLPGFVRRVSGDLTENLGRVSAGHKVERTWVVEGKPLGLLLTAQSATASMGAEAHVRWPKIQPATTQPVALPIPPVKFRGITIDRAIPLCR